MGALRVGAAQTTAVRSTPKVAERQLIDAFHAFSNLIYRPPNATDGWASSREYFKDPNARLISGIYDPLPAEFAKGSGFFVGNGWQLTQSKQGALLGLHYEGRGAGEAAWQFDARTKASLQALVSAARAVYASLDRSKLETLPNRHDTSQSLDITPKGSKDKVHLAYTNGALRIQINGADGRYREARIETRR
ncbi:MAG: hypothetical protein ACOZIN_12515 [Myxococcota bacterium]